MAEKITKEQQLAEIHSMLAAQLVTLEGVHGAMRVVLKAEMFGIMAEMISEHLEGRSFKPIAEERLNKRG